MKYQRLLTMLLLLQTHHRMTATELADALSVSVRTVLRDVKTLADADVPVFVDRGRYGGIVLLPGAQLDVSRLSPAEVDALKVLGLDAGQARQLRVDEPRAAAARKLATRRKPTPDRDGLPLSELVIVDNTAWFSNEQPAIVADLARDLRQGRRLRVCYRASSKARSSWRTVDPYGLLAKAGRWYLVADAAAEPHLYALTRLRAWNTLPEPRRLRPGAALADTALVLTASVEDRGQVKVTAELRSDRLDLAQRILGARLSATHHLDHGRVTIVVNYDQIEAVRQLLQFGEHLRVTHPPEAVAVIRAVAQATVAMY